MGGGILLLVWIIIGLLFVSVWIGLLLAFRRGIKHGSRWMSWAFGIPFLLVSTFLIYFTVTNGLSLYQATKPKVIFERSFGFKPTEDVGELESSYWYFADTGLTYLKFKASPETVQRIVDRGLIQTNPAFFNSLLDSGLTRGSPKWWTPPNEASVKVFYIERKPETRDHQDFASETEVLSYDVKTGTAYYCFNGID